MAAKFRLRAAVLLAWVGGGLVCLFGCDPDGRKECAWVLEPEQDGKAEDGYIPVCARNRKTMKQDCAMQATLDYAKEVYGRKFRYIDIRFVSPGQLHTVSKIKFCD